MKKIYKATTLATCLILTSNLFFVGCASTPKTELRHSSKATASNEHFVVTMEPVYEYSSFVAFKLSIQNKESQPIEIDWNRTQFIENGQTRGGFMFEGMRYVEMNAAKQPDIVLANSSFSKTIWPIARVERASTWWHDRILPRDQFIGTYGISLLVLAGERQVRENITMQIERVSVQR